MTRITKALFATATTAVIVAGIAAFTGAQAAPKVRLTKRATISCQPGWRGSAVGTYGGVLFSVACQNGKGNTTINGVNGIDYSIRVGVESDSIGADCLFQGSSPAVHETCIAVGLTIR